MSAYDIPGAHCTDVSDCDPVEVLVKPKSEDIGTFEVWRALPAFEKRMVGPFS